MTSIHTLRKSPKWLLLLMLSVLTCIPVHAQLTKKSLDKMYKHKDSSQLRQVFQQEFEKSGAAFLCIQNDTTINISKLYYAVFSEQTYTDSNEYFFLQPFFTLIYVGKNQFQLNDSPFIIAQNSALKPIPYNAGMVDALLEFIGSEPTETSAVIEYLRYRDQLMPRKIKAAKKIIAEFDDKIDFLATCLTLPATWGKLDCNLIPCTIGHIRFNETMTEAEVKYDLVSEGGLVVFRLNNGQWEKTKSLIKWTD